MSPVDVDQVRRRTVARAEELRVEAFEDLPTLDPLSLRSEQEAVDRALALHAVLAAIYFLDAERARAWLDEHGLGDALSTDERRIVDGERPGSEAEDDVGLRVEGLYALAWALGLVDELDARSAAPDDFVDRFPEIEDDESPDGIREQASLRSEQVIAEQLDLLYVLHHALVEADLAKKTQSALPPEWVVAERRTALEWLTSKTPWDEISLDT